MYELSIPEPHLCLLDDGVELDLAKHKMRLNFKDLSEGHRTFWLWALVVRRGYYLWFLTTSDRSSVQNLSLFFARLLLFLLPSRTSSTLRTRYAFIKSMNHDVKVMDSIDLEEMGQVGTWPVTAVLMQVAGAKLRDH